MCMTERIHFFDNDTSFGVVLPTICILMLKSRKILRGRERANKCNQVLFERCTDL